jgi:hypothetical protein
MVKPGISALGANHLRSAGLPRFPAFTAGAAALTCGLWMTLFKSCLAGSVISTLVCRRWWQNASFLPWVELPLPRLGPTLHVGGAASKISCACYLRHLGTCPWSPRPFRLFGFSIRCSIDKCTDCPCCPHAAVRFGSQTLPQTTIYWDCAQGLMMIS